MKTKLLALLFVLGLITLSCNEDDDTPTRFESTAVIIGFDQALCACCGGWLIDINGEPTLRRFTDLPPNSTIDLHNSMFPIDVRLTWAQSEEYCGNGIQVESIEPIL